MLDKHSAGVTLHYSDTENKGGRQGIQQSDFVNEINEIELSQRRLSPGTAFLVGRQHKITADGLAVEAFKMTAGAVNLLNTSLHVKYTGWVGASLESHF